MASDLPPPTPLPAQRPDRWSKAAREAAIDLRTRLRLTNSGQRLISGVIYSLLREHGSRAHRHGRESALRDAWSAVVALPPDATARDAARLISAIPLESPDD